MAAAASPMLMIATHAVVILAGPLRLKFSMNCLPYDVRITFLI